MLRRYIINAPYFSPAPSNEDPDRWELAYNDSLNQHTFEKHAAARDLPQKVELELEVSAQDIANMQAIQTDMLDLRGSLGKRFYPDPWKGVEEWEVTNVHAGQRVLAVWHNGSLQTPGDKVSRDFLSYLHVFEGDNALRAEVGRAALQLPMIYLPVNRAVNGFDSRVGLSGWNDFDQKRNSDAASSRSGSNIVALAIGRMAKRFRLLQEQSNVDAREKFRDDQNLISLSKELEHLGYSWELVTVDPLNNTYDVRLNKQGTTFLVSAASSGERELLSYLFAIFALNVRNAVIIVDEPELHLHPRWQKSLFSLFERLSKATGNQFVIATHSPTFISPASIQYVSRVFSENQASNIVRLSTADMPGSKHLFNIVNSESNERIFFTDRVVLVEGLHDKIFFERIIELVAKKYGIGTPFLEVIGIGGKGLFSAYEKLLDACKISWWAVADLDYIEQIGNQSIKALFVVDDEDIKRDVIDNIKSLDAASLVARIDEAFSSGNWADATDLWAYIKSRRVRLKGALTAEEENSLASFIQQLRADRVYLLSRGELEDYLPESYRSKDTQKLIELVTSEDFWDRLAPDARTEIEGMAAEFLGCRESFENADNPANGFA